MAIKKGDIVYIIAGRDKGKQGEVEQVLLNKLVVAGVNMRKRHFKPSQNQRKTGIVEFPAPLSSANTMVVCPHCSKSIRVKVMTGEDGKRYRYCNKCQGSLDRK